MAGHRLLIVEDHEATRDTLRDHYHGMGWQVVAAGTVAGALEALEAGPAFCGILLDLRLPDGEGIAVLERVRARGLMTRVAVCTGDVDLGRLKAVAALRPDAMLPKPIRLPEIWADLCAVCAPGSAGAIADPGRAGA